ncbi:MULTISPECIES: ABC transporter permease [Halobacterium]|uniref:ABC transporter permease n=1 Tax=Halobacterium TaxID=2239 RepID=UPI0019628FCD|nr:MULTISPECIES: ABC transporter permease subunit [Halobacterium]MCF2165783.1 ABC transporter permease [Halobacterium salinarum]MCF2168872.1 ABC transporter permease [Halobacterium salinarum]MCF2237646.1 ABC transporter permease [Halobacterium salinarum]QRY21495.1 ABC transporter permease subunit [Halobacterium sp. GSL-19]WJK64832.2 ABC transporter permease subunit [Halobacterium salinarum]
MPSTAVARTEFKRFIRGKTPWVIVLAMLLMNQYAPTFTPAQRQLLGEALAFTGIQVVVAIIVPFAALALGVRAIIGDRETGTARVLLGTELTRSEFVIAKTVGRGAAISVPVVGFVCVVVGSNALQSGRFSLPIFLVVLLASVVYAFAWTGVIVGISAASSSTTRAALLSCIVFLFGGLLWSSLTRPMVWTLATGSPPDSQAVQSALFADLGWGSLPNSYFGVTNWAFGWASRPEPITNVVSEVTLANKPSVPTALQSWVGLVVGVAWPGASLALGCARFKRRPVSPGTQVGYIRALWQRRPTLPSRSNHAPGESVGQSGVSDMLPGSWQPVARREFQRLLRGPGVWVLGIAVFTWSVLTRSQPSLAVDYFGSTLPLAVAQRPIMSVGLVGVLFGSFRAVTVERETGRIRVAAGTAISRSELLAGTVAGRTAAFVIPIVLAVLGVCVSSVPSTGVVPLHTLAPYLLLIIAYVGCLTCIGVGISTLVRRQAVGAVLTTGIIGIQLSWYNVSNLIYRGITGITVSGFSPPADPVYVLLRWLPPINVFSVATNAVLDAPNSAGNAIGILSELQRGSYSQDVIVTQVFDSTVPEWFLHPSITVALFAIWCGVVGGLAVLVFQRRPLD